MYFTDRLQAFPIVSKTKWMGSLMNKFDTAKTIKQNFFQNFISSSIELMLSW